MLNYFQKFIANESGYAAPLFAIASIPIMGAVGLAVDYSAAASDEVKLKTAIESTSLTLARMSVKDPSLTSQDLIAKGKEIIALKVGKPVSYSNFEVDTKYVSVNISANLEYKTHFGRFVGQDEIKVSGLSEAVFEIQDIDFYMVLDNSPSMAIGATTEDINNLRKVTKTDPHLNTCGFACHAADSKVNSYELAKQKGITLRFDAVKQALTELTSRMEEKESINQKFRMTAVHMGTYHDKVTPLEPKTFLNLSADYKNMRKETSELEVMKVKGHGGVSGQSTNYVQVMDHVTKLINSDITANKNKDDRKKRIMFLVTDGLNDSKVYGPCKGSRYKERCMQPIDTRLCDTLKNNDVQIAVLHTLYLDLPDSPFWNDHIRHQKDTIPAALEECASDGLYYAVDFESGAVTNAMAKLFDKTVRSLQLTNLN